MPTYDYRCKKCGHRFELFHSITDDTPRRCPKCRSRAVRVPAGGAGLLFKGSGFYITDYRSKSYRDKARQEKAGGSSSTSGKEKGGEAGSSSTGGKEKGGGAGSSSSGGKKTPSGD